MLGQRQHGLAAHDHRAAVGPMRGFYVCKVCFHQPSLSSSSSITGSCQYCPISLCSHKEWGSARPCAGRALVPHLPLAMGRPCWPPFALPRVPRRSTASLTALRRVPSPADKSSLSSFPST